MFFVYRVLPFQYSPEKTAKCAAPQVRNPRKHWCTSTIACIVYGAGGTVPSSCIVPVKLLGTTGDRYILLIVPRIGTARGAQKKTYPYRQGRRGLLKRSKTNYRIYTFIFSICTEITTLRFSFSFGPFWERGSGFSCFLPAPNLVPVSGLLQVLLAGTYRHYQEITTTAYW